MVYKSFYYLNREEKCMSKFNFSDFGITLDNVKDFEAGFAEYKKTLKADAKQATATAKAMAKDNCNSAIADGTIVKGAKVIIKYNKQEVEGTLANTPTVDSKNLPVTSDSFANKDKFLYVAKENFVRVI